MSSPRAWTIFEGHSANPRIQGSDIAYAENVEVVEKSALYVPGHFRCPKCEFSLIQKSLYVKSGTVGANNTPAECANGCGPMWRVTWKEHAQSFAESCERLFDEKHKYKKALEETKEALAHNAAEIEEINLKIHGDLHGCDCEGGCNCKPELWCRLEQLKYHNFGSQTEIDEALGIAEGS